MITAIASKFDRSIVLSAGNPLTLNPRKRKHPGEPLRGSVFIRPSIQISQAAKARTISSLMSTDVFKKVFSEYLTCSELFLLAQTSRGNKKVLLDLPRIKLLKYERAKKKCLTLEALVDRALAITKKRPPIENNRVLQRRVVDLETRVDQHKDRLFNKEIYVRFLLEAGGVTLFKKIEKYLLRHQEKGDWCIDDTNFAHMAIHVVRGGDTEVIRAFISSKMISSCGRQIFYHLCVFSEHAKHYAEATKTAVVLLNYSETRGRIKDDVTSVVQTAAALQNMPILDGLFSSLIMPSSLYEEVNRCTRPEGVHCLIYCAAFHGDMQIINKALQDFDQVLATKARELRNDHAVTRAFVRKKMLEIQEPVLQASLVLAGWRHHSTLVVALATRLKIMDIALALCNQTLSTVVNTQKH